MKTITLSDEAYQFLVDYHYVFRRLHYVEKTNPRLLILLCDNTYHEQMAKDVPEDLHPSYQFDGIFEIIQKQLGFKHKSELDAAISQYEAEHGITLGISSDYIGE